MQSIKKIYSKLFEIYGSRGWWPVTPIGGCKGDKAFKPIYGIKNKNEKQELEIIFGAILTQNTSWKNVEKAIIELNKNDLINIDKIIKINNKKLAAIIKSSGYHNQKAKKLKNISHFLKEYPIEKLKDMDSWEARRLLLDVDGIGKETADSILLYSFNKPIFVVDNYTKRIFSNLGMIKESWDYDKIQKLFMDNLSKEAYLFNEYHALIVEHGKKFYKRKEDYKNCPLYKEFNKKKQK